MVYFIFSICLGNFNLYYRSDNTKSKRNKKVFEGYPSIIIRNGKIDREQLSVNHLDINQLQQMLRQQKDIFSIREVEYMILEPNGNISVLKK